MLALPLLILLFFTPTTAISTRLSESPEWHRLIHYRKTPGGFKSEVDGDEFFLSPDGKTSPESELQATLAAFSRGPRPPEAPAHCRFPARWLYLRPHLTYRPMSICPAFEHFKNELETESVSLVFSSYFLNHPASAFGHTFLKLHRKTYGGKRFDLLDQGVNFAAVVDDENPVVYALKGLFGLFEGRFTRLPYYYKVREYNDYESRDLWEYELSLTPDEIERLLAHLWELGSTHFDYFYLSENCAYHILALLETARPGLQLSDGMPAMVLPIETLKRVVDVPNLVKRVNFRPSLRAQFRLRERSLPRSSSRILADLISDHNLVALNELSNTESARVLDAAADFEDLHHFKELHLEPGSEAARWKSSLLEHRSRLATHGNLPSDATLSTNYPHLTHGVSRAAFDAGHTSGENFWGAQFRLALHDLLDSPVGYPDPLQLKILDTRVRLFPEGPRFKIDHLSLFDVASLLPVSPFSKTLSWRARLGGKTIKDSSCDSCFAGVIEVGAGPSWEILRALSVTALLETEANFAPAFSRSFARVGLGPHLFLLTQSRFLSAQVGARYLWQWPAKIKTSYSLYAEIRMPISHDLALGLRSERFPSAWENIFSLYGYF